MSKKSLTRKDKLKLIESPLLVVDNEDDCDNNEDSDVDEDGDVRQEVMQKDGQSESEREHDEGGATTYQSGQSSGGSFFCYCISQRSKRRSYL